MRTIGLMAESRWDSQPTQLVHAPKAYPSHDFKGAGTVWAVYLNDVLLGRLSYTGQPAEAVVWQPAPSLDDASYEYANAITMLLVAGANDDVPLPEVLAEVFELGRIQETLNAELAGLRP